MATLEVMADEALKTRVSCFAVQKRVVAVRQPTMLNWVQNG